MVGSNYQFWDHVTRRVDGCLKCTFCGSEFARGTSISRIKSHFSGIEGRGVNICESVPDDVKEEAYKAIQSTNKRRKIKSCSSNIEVGHAVPPSLREQTNKLGNGARDVEMKEIDSWIVDPEQTDEFENEVLTNARMVQPEAQIMELEMVEGREQRNCNESMTEDLILPIERASLRNEPVVDVQENIGNTLQTTEEVLVALATPMSLSQINSLPREDGPSSNGREKIIGELTQPIDIGILDGPAHKTRGVTLWTTEPVGRAFERKKKKIWSWLMNDKVSRIGVYGMGGVGKTTLMTHINNQLLEKPNTFAHVFWVGVSQDFGIYELQNQIAKAIKFDLSKEGDERIRAARLRDELNGKQKFVLILDNLWNEFDVEEVGIPIGMNGCKLILTTRCLDICRKMLVCKENVIKVEPLAAEEAWTLFKKELGDYNIELEPLAKSVARECAGLPLGLRTMARSMRGVDDDDESEWRNALEELKEAEKREDDMEPKVFRILRFSYDRLKDPTVQECFLYCALFPEDFKIQREDLIEYWIVEGMIEKNSRKAEYDKGHSILNKLENACLLEGFTNWKDGRDVKMHDLIRDMAVQKLKERFSVMVKAGVQLKQLPEVEKWIKDLVRVSLMRNNIVEIPSGHSSRCPTLSTLLLCHNPINFIADSFSKQLDRLKVLDLSHTYIDKLPDSISELESLIALLLSMCRNLRHVPSLAKLKALKKLDLSFTDSLEEVPAGMELLSNLRYLNLFESSIKELPVRILPKLSQLQVLVLGKVHFDCLNGFGVLSSSMAVKGNEVACLRKLETLTCGFKHLSDFKEYMESREETLLLSFYTFAIGQDCILLPRRKPSLELCKRVWLCYCSISRDQDFLLFPKDIEELVFQQCSIPRTLFCGSTLRWSNELKYIHLYCCDGIKSLLSLSTSSSPAVLKSLERLELYYLKDFCSLISREEACLLRCPYGGTFSCLKEFEITKCHSVKKLFSHGLLSNLQSLETIIVEYCYKMEEILAIEEGGEKDDDDEKEEEEEGIMSEKFILPKLRRLELRNLPELKSICSGVMICDSIEKIVLYDCPRLKRIPLSLPLLSLQYIRVNPKEWWESVTWGQLNDKNLFQPILGCCRDENFFLHGTSFDHLLLQMFNF